MSTDNRLLPSKPTKLVFSNYSWTGKSPSEVCRILNCDHQDSNEFVIAGNLSYSFFDQLYVQILMHHHHVRLFSRCPKQVIIYAMQLLKYRITGS